MLGRGLGLGLRLVLLYSDGVGMLRGRYHFYYIMSLVYII